MRYRIGETPTEPGPPVDGTFTGVGIYGVVLGVGFTVAGYRGRQRWLLLWGALLTLASALYLLAPALGLLPGPGAEQQP
ncbi:MAG: hypothetical protein PVI50_05970 [Gammaproteobacteria bacterium]|jgi:hypothetical protein